jgi:putative alpha-1,2-mannosidase
MQGKVQFIFRRSMILSFGALLFAASFAGHLAWSQKTLAKSTRDFTPNVDPFIGVDWGGNTFVGSAIPYGLVKVGPDMETFDGRRSGFGYSSNGVILGFSHLHPLGDSK